MGETFPHTPLAPLRGSNSRLARYAIDVVDAVDGADGAQHVTEVLGVTHLEREPAEGDPVPAGSHGSGQDVHVLVGQHPGHVGEQPGTVQRLYLDGDTEDRAFAW